jgi:ATP-dependent HslUV protease ATP-binding subunit HslU
VNEQTENIGARRLATLLERVLEDVSFEAPETAGELAVDAAYVRSRLDAIAGDANLSAFIL